MRKSTALIAAVGLLLSLTACAGGTTTAAEAANCVSPISGGTAANLISSKSAYGTVPKLTFPTPISTTGAEKKVLVKGTGAVVQDGSPVTLFVSQFNARTGAKISVSTYKAGGESLVIAGGSSKVAQALVCAQVGSRLAVVGSAKETHNNQADATQGVKKNDSIIYVLDVKQTMLAKANGSNVVPTNGVPSVVLTDTGRPGITVPDDAAPKSFNRYVLKQGSGKKLTKGAYAVVKYTGVGWTDKKVFDSTWTADSAAILQLGATTVTEGLSKGLIGERVGSQVEIIVPPKLASGGAAGTGGVVPSGDTGVYVVDILGIYTE
ncbi:FKBP-type peptidyl-prolyl cis-trans isomerase [soil metagenome]